MTSKTLFAFLVVTVMSNVMLADPIPKKKGSNATLPAKCKDGMKLISESKMYYEQQHILTYEMTRACKKIKETDEGTIYEWTTSTNVTKGIAEIKSQSVTMLVGQDGKTHLINYGKITEQPREQSLKKGETKKVTVRRDNESFEMERTWLVNETVEFNKKLYDAKVIKSVQTFKDKTIENTMWNATIDGVDLSLKSIQKTDQTVTETILKEFVAGK